MLRFLQGMCQLSAPGCKLEALVDLNRSVHDTRCWLRREVCIVNAVRTATLHLRPRKRMHLESLLTLVTCHACLASSCALSVVHAHLLHAGFCLCIVVAKVMHHFRGQPPCKYTRQDVHGQHGMPSCLTKTV